MKGYVAGGQSAPATSPKEPLGAATSLFSELKPPLDFKSAFYEALRCLYCGGDGILAPCTLACPAAIDVPKFIKAIAKGEPGLAAQVIFSANPLGGSCARVCPTEELCEGSCVLEEQGRRPVSIGRLQRYAADKLLDNPDTATNLVETNGVSHKVSVIGAGPAGMACASRLAQWGYSVTVYDSRPEPGGLVRFAIAPYRLLKEPLMEEKARLEQMGVQFRFNHPILGTSAVRTLENESEAIFLGVGLGEDVPISYPGDHLPGVWQSLAFIEEIKTGHLPSVGRRVAVIGGGNTAIDVAREALRLGAEEVTIVYRRTEAEMPAYRQEVKDAEREGVRFLWLTIPVRLLGTNRLESMECQNMRLGEPDATGRRRPEPISGTEFILPIDTVIRAVGQRHRTELQDWIPNLEMKNGLIAVHSDSMQTSNRKYFAGGDAVNGGATVVEAVRMGKVAAEGIRAYLEPSLAVPEDTTTSMTLPDVLDLVPQMTYHQGSASLKVNRDWCKGCNICVEDCPAGILALDDNELVYVTHIDHCILCGICALRCPDFVFSLATPDGEVMAGPGDDTLMADDGLKDKTGGHQYATSARK